MKGFVMGRGRLWDEYTMRVCEGEREIKRDLKKWVNYISAEVKGPCYILE